MKRFPFMLSILTCLSMTLATGCQESAGNSTAEIQSDTQQPEHNIVYSYSSTADLAKVAYNLDELVEASDFIAEVRVKETSSFVAGDTIMINTKITPEIIKTYKGEYNGNSLIIGGGYMNCKEYAMSVDASDMPKNPVDISKFTKDELENGEVYFNWLNNYIPEKDDTIIYFGYENDDGDYNVTYSYQGVFLCKNNNVSNQALCINEHDFTEPLVKDLSSTFSKTSEISTFSSRTVESKEVLSIPENEFTAKLESFK